MHGHPRRVGCGSLGDCAQHDASPRVRGRGDESRPAWHRAGQRTAEEEVADGDQEHEKEDEVADEDVTEVADGEATAKAIAVEIAFPKRAFSKAIFASPMTAMEGFVEPEEGEGFERINLACPRSTLDEALVRIRDAIRAGTA